MAAVDAVAPDLGATQACRALGISRATLYRRRRPPAPPASSSPRPRPRRALSDAERQAVRAVLRASQRGQLQVAGERVQAGLTHARQVLTVHVAEREFRIFDQGGLIKTIARRDRQEVTRFKAHNHHKPHGNKG